MLCSICVYNFQELTQISSYHASMSSASAPTEMMVKSRFVIVEIRNLYPKGNKLNISEMIPLTHLALWSHMET